MNSPQRWRNVTGGVTTADFICISCRPIGQEYDVVSEPPWYDGGGSEDVVRANEAAEVEYDEFVEVDSDSVKR